MSLNILRSIARYFAIMADECVDVSNHEQLVICLCWVNHCLNVHEDFLGLYHIADTSADAITSVIKDCLVSSVEEMQRLVLRWGS